MSLASALRTGDVAELPSRRQEDWRWTDLRGLIRAIPPASPPSDAAAIVAGPFDAIAGDEIVLLNGRLVGTPSLPLIPAKAGIQSFPESSDRWTALDPRFRGDERSKISAPRIVVEGERTIRLRFISAAMNTAHHVELDIELKPGATLTLLESYEGSGEGYVADAALDISLSEGSRLERIVLVEEAADAVAVSTSEVRLAPHSAFTQTVLTRGAKRQRHETRVHHPGGAADLRLDGLYLLGGARHADLTTVVQHEGLDGRTSQLTKGAVRDQARGVFQGRIVVALGADRTEARMGHHALILSDKAEVDAKPELEIYADDVVCAHGNTVGALDEEALFYARSRGIPEAEARAMLTEAFLGEVADRIGHEGAREIARSWLAGQLRAGG